MKNIKEKGITLVALIITIILLLVLAGITIGQLIGNGIFESAKDASEEYLESQEMEMLDLEYYEYLTKQDESQTFLDFLDEKGYEIIYDDQENESGKVIINGKTFKISQNGKIKNLEEKNTQNTQNTSNATLITDIKLNKESAKMEKGEQLLLSADLLPEDATDKQIEWISSNPSVASIDKNGLVTAITNGETIITAKSKDGSNVVSTNSCKIKVRLEPQVSNIGRVYTTSTNDYQAAINVFDTNIQYTSVVNREEDISSYISVSYSDYTWRITALSSNLYYSTYDNESDITKLQKFIELKWNYKESKDLYFYIDETELPDYYIVVDSEEIEIIKGDDYQLGARVIPKSVENIELEWKSLNENIATVDDEGKVTATGKGETTIIVSSKEDEDKIATVTVKVTNIRELGRVYTTSTSGSAAAVNVLGTGVSYGSVSNKPKNIKSYVSINYNTSQYSWELEPLMSNIYYSTSNDISDLSKWEKLTSETWKYNANRSWYLISIID